MISPSYLLSVVKIYNVFNMWCNQQSSEWDISVLNFFHFHSLLNLFRSFSLSHARAFALFLRLFIYIRTLITIHIAYSVRLAVIQFYHLRTTLFHWTTTIIIIKFRHPKLALFVSFLLCEIHTMSTFITTFVSFPPSYFPISAPFISKFRCGPPKIRIEWTCVCARVSIRSFCCCYYYRLFCAFVRTCLYVCFSVHSFSFGFFVSFSPVCGTNIEKWIMDSASSV